MRLPLPRQRVMRRLRYALMRHASSELPVLRHSAVVAVPQAVVCHEARMPLRQNMAT